MNEDLTKARQELDNQQAERTRISYVCIYFTTFPTDIMIRQLETEINEKLLDVHNKLLQAGVDQKESEREARLKETLSNLQRIFPGMHHYLTMPLTLVDLLMVLAQVCVAEWSTCANPRNVNTRWPSLQFWEGTLTQLWWTRKRQQSIV